MTSDLILKYFPDLSQDQKQKFDKLNELYRFWNAQINVISRKDIDMLYLHHILHSLAIARVMKFLPGENIMDAVVYRKTYSVSDFVHDYNSFRGNAYGLANTLWQTAIFRPSCRSKKINNLFFTGQLTVPGPGVPPSLISGEVVAKQVIKAFG